MIVYIHVTACLWWVDKLLLLLIAVLVAIASRPDFMMTYDHDSMHQGCITRRLQVVFVKIMKVLLSVYTPIHWFEFPDNGQWAED